MPSTATPPHGDRQTPDALPVRQDELAVALYGEMRRIAQSLFSGEAPGHTLSRTALISEAWMRLTKQPMPSEPTDFLRLAARVMRNVLVDHARARNAVKRGGDVQVTSLDQTVRYYANACATGLYPSDGDTCIAQRVARELDLDALDDAISVLEELSPRQAQVVELKFFAGLGMEEIAAELGVSLSTVKREWTVARLFLLREMSEAQHRNGEPAT
jgi:RNA polymerase sigma factor (sigma-70 family)